MKKVLVPLAPGFEEIEAVTIIDVLRRAEVDVVVAGLGRGAIEGSRGIQVVAECGLDEVDMASFDVIALPGGGYGAKALRENESMLEGLRKHYEDGKVVAAICAAPTVLVAAGLAEGRALTCHPFVHDLIAEAGADLKRTERVVIDGTLVTSQAPGTAMEFAFKLVEILCGQKKVEELNAAMLARL